MKKASSLEYVLVNRKKDDIGTPVTGGFEEYCRREEERHDKQSNFKIHQNKTEFNSPNSLKIENSKDIQDKMNSQ